MHGFCCSLRAAPGRLSRTGRPLPAMSAAREGGLPGPILDETAHSRALILGREQSREVQPLDLQAGVEVGFQAVVDRLFRGPQGQRRARCVASHQAARGPVGLRVEDNLVHEADRVRFGRGDESSGVDDVLRPGRPDQARQPLGTARTRDDPEQDLRLAEADRKSTRLNSSHRTISYAVFCLKKKKKKQKKQIDKKKKKKNKKEK